jgi:cytochrome c-type biogenesis protein
MSIEQAVATGGPWALPLALAGGVLAGINPCCLGLYPGVMATICVADGARRSHLMKWRAAAFVVGTVLATTFLGVLAAAAGHAVMVLGSGPRYAVAFILIVVGLTLIGWLRWPLPFRSPLIKVSSSVPAAFLAGLVFSMTISVCATPLFAAILSFAAYKESLVFGGLLLFSYGLGSGLPLLVVGTGVGAVVARFERLRAWGDRVAGGIVLGVAFLLIVRI